MAKVYVIRKPTGEEVEVKKKDLNSFCIDNELDRTHLHKTKYNKENGGREHHKGFKILEEKKEVILVDKRSKFPKNEKMQNKRVLAIGDLHSPFIKDGYLSFCKKMYKKWNCDTVVFMGDIIDNHFTSYHETDPDSHGAGKEFDLAKKEIQKFYKAFPKAFVCTGNHDILPNRKAFSGGISKRWIKTMDEVLDTPGWQFRDSWIIDGVKYSHGVGSNAKAKRNKDMKSQVNAHRHSESYIDFLQGEDNRLFSMQIGVGCDQEEYAFAYAKNFAKFHVNVGVILDGGKLPIIEYMK